MNGINKNKLDVKKNIKNGKEIKVKKNGTNKIGKISF